MIGPSTGVRVNLACGVTDLRKGIEGLYRPQFLRHRVEAYAASAAIGSCLCRMAAGVWKPCRAISQVEL
jgi:hypothetical protein